MYQDNLIAKLFLFQSVNSFSSFIYIAFIAQPGLDEVCHPTCIQLLMKNLIIIFMTQIVLGVGAKVLLPFLLRKWKSRKTSRATKAKANRCKTFQFPCLRNGGLETDQDIAPQESTPSPILKPTVSPKSKPPLGHDHSDPVSQTSIPTNKQNNSPTNESLVEAEHSNPQGFPNSLELAAPSGFTGISFSSSFNKKDDSSSSTDPIISFLESEILENARLCDTVEGHDELAVGDDRYEANLKKYAAEIARIKAAFAQDTEKVTLFLKQWLKVAQADNMASTAGQSDEGPLHERYKSLDSAYFASFSEMASSVVNSQIPSGGETKHDNDNKETTAESEESPPRASPVTWKDEKENDASTFDASNVGKEEVFEEIAEKLVKQDMGTTEEEFKKTKYDEIMGTIFDFAELVLQFGYMTLFVSAFPLAPFMGLLNNYVLIRANALHLLLNCQRPVPRSTEDIGTWQVFLEIINGLAVMSNAALVCFIMQKVWPTSTHLSTRLWAFLIFQVFLYCASLVVRSMTNDIPNDVMVQLMRTEFFVSKVIDKMPDDDNHSECEKEEATNNLKILNKELPVCRDGALVGLNKYMYTPICESPLVETNSNMTESTRRSSMFALSMSNSNTAITPSAREPSIAVASLFDPPILKQWCTKYSLQPDDTMK